MISYYRIYYDQQLTNFDDLVYIYIYTPLSSFEMSQNSVCDFINNNPQYASFNCKLNEDIYAIVRYIPADLECYTPIIKELIFDIIMFTTPVKNKMPSIVESKSIKSLYPLTLILKEDEIESSLYESLKLIYYDYSFENSEIDPTENQLTNYIMLRITVSNDNVFNSDDITNIGIQQADCMFTSVNSDLSVHLSKYELLREINDVSIGYFVLVCNENIIIIDCFDKTYVYSLIKYQGSLINIKRSLFSTVVNKINSSIDSKYVWYYGVYYYQNDIEITSTISKINSYSEKDPFGNFYMICTFDDSLITSALSEMVS